MASFTTFLDILPDPNTPIGDAGQALATGSGASPGQAYGIVGPGFSSVKLSSNKKTMVSKTNSGRAVSRSIAGHTWQVDIKYNPLTRDQFEPVYGFLLSRLGRLNPFYVKLPQQSVSRNSTFTTYAASNTIRVEAGDETGDIVPAGRTYMLIDGFNSTSGEPRPGDMFTITDAVGNANHVKAYRITRVETHSNYNSAVTNYPAGNTEKRIHFTPPLAYLVTDNSVLDFTDPMIRVRLTGDVQEYSLGTNNLYSFSLKLEEALP